MRAQARPMNGGAARPVHLTRKARVPLQIFEVEHEAASSTIFRLQHIDNFRGVREGSLTALHTVAYCAPSSLGVNLKQSLPSLAPVIHRLHFWHRLHLPSRQEHSFFFSKVRPPDTYHFRHYLTSISHSEAEGNQQRRSGGEKGQGLGFSGNHRSVVYMVAWQSL